MRVGGEINAASYHYGRTASTSGEYTGIHMADLTLGGEVPNLGGVGAGVGGFLDSEGRYGVYVHVVGDAIGEHGALGIGLPLGHL